MRHDPGRPRHKGRRLATSADACNDMNRPKSCRAGQNRCHKVRIVWYGPAPCAVLEQARGAPTRGPAGISGDSALPAAGGAASPGTGSPSSARRHLAGGAERRPTQELYALETQLARSAGVRWRRSRRSGGRGGAARQAPDRARRGLAVGLRGRGAPRGTDPAALPARPGRPGGDPPRRRVAGRGGRRARGLLASRPATATCSSRSAPAQARRAAGRSAGRRRASPRCERQRRRRRDGGPPRGGAGRAPRLPRAAAPVSAASRPAGSSGPEPAAPPRRRARRSPSPPAKDAATRADLRRAGRPTGGAQTGSHGHRDGVRDPRPHRDGPRRPGGASSPSTRP